MKKIIATFVGVLVLSQNITVFAQYDSGFDSFEPAPVTNYQYNSNTYANPVETTVDTTCVGCGVSSWGGTPVTTGGVISSGGTPPPVYGTPSINYGTPSVSFGTPSLTTVPTNSSWTSSSFSWVTPSTSYTFPSYNYSTPTYTFPSYSWTTPTYSTLQCDNGNGYYSNGSQCVKQCLNSGSVIYPNQCPTVTQINCPTGYTPTSSNTCVKLCANNTTVTYPNTCTDGIMCTQEVRLCPDGSTMRRDPNCAWRADLCPQIPVTQCLSGYTLVNGACIRYCANNVTVTQPNTCPTVNTTSCPVPYLNSNGTCVLACANNVTVAYPNTCPSVQTVQCDTWNGYYAQNGICVKNCWSGGTVTYPNSCPTYVPPTPVVSQTQVCADGSVISAYSVCPQTFKTCSDGSIVSIYTSCPITQVIQPIREITVNNVITSIPTQIANTSARCNGIGLIANNLQTVAWFEYGRTPNLGSKTAVANIGSAPTSPFTNLLTGLKPQTDYYCRAVMANNLGVVKGDIVHFKTTSVIVRYPSKTTVITPKKTVSTIKKETKAILCSDGTTQEVTNSENKGNSALSLIHSGKKAMTLTLVKTQGDVAPNETVSYTATFKNESSSNLTDVKLTISLPEEMMLIKSNKGTYDVRTRELTIAFPVVAPGENGVIELQSAVAKEAVIGKSVAVQSHVSYVIPPETKTGKPLSDDTVAYVVSTIISQPLADTNPLLEKKTAVEKNDTSSSTQETKDSFLPNTIVEWVALFAIILIIILLIKTLKESGKGNEDAHH